MLVMRNFIIQIILLCFGVGYAQENEFDRQLVTYSHNIQMINDTMFIHKERDKGFYHDIYIDTTQATEHDLWYNNFELDYNDSIQMYKSYTYDKKRFPELYTQHYDIDLPKEWIPVYKFGESYYKYGSNWDIPFKYMITDTAFVFWNLWHISPVSYLEVQKESYKWSFEIASFGTQKSDRKTVNIYLIDSDSKVYLFEIYTCFSEKYYMFCIPKSHSPKFNTIVDVSSKRVDKFQFDEVDFKQLIEELPKRIRKIK